MCLCVRVSVGVPFQKSSLSLSNTHTDINHKIVALIIYISIHSAVARIIERDRMPMITIAWQQRLTDLRISFTSDDICWSNETNEKMTNSINSVFTGKLYYWEKISTLHRFLPCLDSCFEVLQVILNLGWLDICIIWFTDVLNKVSIGYNSNTTVPAFFFLLYLNVFLNRKHDSYVKTALTWLLFRFCWNIPWLCEHFKLK